MKESNNDMKNAIHHIVKVIEKKVEIDKGVIHQIIIQYIKAIIPKKMNEYHLYMDLSDCYFKKNVDLSQFEYVKTYIFDLQDYQSYMLKRNINNFKIQTSSFLHKEVVVMRKDKGVVFYARVSKDTEDTVTFF